MVLLMIYIFSKFTTFYNSNSKLVKYFEIILPSYSTFYYMIFEFVLNHTFPKLHNLFQIFDYRFIHLFLVIRLFQQLNITLLVIISDLRFLEFVVQDLSQVVIHKYFIVFLKIYVLVLVKICLLEGILN